MAQQTSDDTWLQPVLKGPTYFFLSANDRLRRAEDKGIKLPTDSTSIMNAWHALDFDTRMSYKSRPYQDEFEAAIADFNANIPLSPSVSGESFDEDDDDDDIEDGGVRDRRAIQQWNRYRRDYRKKEASDAFLSPGQPFPFTKLPFDIRRMLYVLLVKQVRHVTQMNPDGTGKHPSGPIDLRFAVASKQTFGEIMRVFFEENTIELHIHPNETVGLPILFNSKAVSAAYWPLESIKRIDLDISYNQPEQSNFVGAELKKLCRVIQHTSLAQLRITACCVADVLNDDLNEPFDQLLACLESVRGVQELIFTEDLDSVGKMDTSSEMFRNIGTADYRKRLQQIMTEPRDTTKK